MSTNKIDVNFEFTIAVPIIEFQKTIDGAQKDARLKGVTKSNRMKISKPIRNLDIYSSLISGVEKMNVELKIYGDAIYNPQPVHAGK